MTAEYEAVLKAMLERPTSLTVIKPLLDAMAKIDEEDNFGLTVSMRAAAYGLCDVVEAATACGADIMAHNSKTRANLLHYAAQQPNGGAGIVKWVMRNASDDLLSDRIFVPGTMRKENRDWDRGNGHTVAFEAVFNNNLEVIKALLELRENGRRVDFEEPAVHGRRPLGWAFLTGANKIADLLVRKLYPQLKTDDARDQEENRDSLRRLQR